ncbi:MAG: metallophosphoesterase [Phototrophicaceae bacterium]
MLLNIAIIRLIVNDGGGMSQPQILVIGDIHGCYDELQALLDKVPLSDGDWIVHVGDLVDRGPKPREVVQFFKTTPNAFSIMGNREHKHILAHQGVMDYNPSRATTKHQMGSEENYIQMLAYFQMLPVYMEFPTALVVHAYFESGKRADEQRRAVLLGHPEGEEHLLNNGIDPETWYKTYDGDRPIIVGHREYPFLNYKDRVFALDTRCVYGGKLTGLLLPNFEPYSVDALDDHATATKRIYSQFRA